MSSSLLTPLPAASGAPPASAQHDPEIVDRALGRLTRLLDETGERPPEPRIAAEPLAEAFRLVAAAMGLELRPSTGRRGDGGGTTVVELCEDHQIRYRQVVLRGRWWQRDHGPLLADLRTDVESADPASRQPGTQQPETRQPTAKQPGAMARPVALLPRPAGGYERVDPTDDTRVVVDADEADRLAESAWMLYRSLPDRPLGLLDLLRFGWRGLGGDFSTLALASLSGALLALATPLLTERMVNGAIAHADRSELLQISLLLVVSLLAGALFQLAHGLTQLRLKTRIDGSLQVALWDRLLSLPVNFLRRFSVGDLGARILGLERIRELLGNDVTASLLALTSAGFSLALLLWYSWPLALVALLLSTLLVALLGGLFRGQLRHQRALQAAGGHLEALTYAILSGIVKLRIGGAEQRAFASWVDRFARQRRHAIALQKLINLQAVLTTIYGTASALVVYGILGLTPLELGIGEFLAFNAALAQFQAAILGASSVLPTLLGFVPTFERIRPVLREIPEDAGERRSPGVLEGHVELDGVSFRYEATGPRVLDRVSLRVEPGEVVAVVGPSGSGKSTCLRLLLGFDQPTSGRVRYDGHDLRFLDRHQVRSQMGVVLQNDRPIVGDLFQNIVAGRPLGLDDAWAAVRRVALEEEVRAMPMGLMTLVNQGGVSFSGGQRQRLLLARALVHRPKILLLDEATSALDNTTQREVIHNLADHEMACLIIAHRLSTIRQADRIYVLDRGRVVEEGTFDGLLAQQGLFASMASKQQV